MLIDLPELPMDPFHIVIFSVIAGNNEGPVTPKLVHTGIYEIGHFGSSDWPPGFEHYPDLDFEVGKPWEELNSYGVCDNYEQILTQCPGIVTSERKFLITLTPILKLGQPAEGGWRWHKWGPYIGTHEITQEYLYDEPVVDQVYVYHIYEQL
jgi:hypothetical protein